MALDDARKKHPGHHQQVSLRCFGLLVFLIIASLLSSTVTPGACVSSGRSFHYFLRCLVNTWNSPRLACFLSPSQPRGTPAELSFCLAVYSVPWHESHHAWLCS